MLNALQAPHVWCKLCYTGGWSFHWQHQMQLVLEHGDVEICSLIPDQWLFQYITVNVLTIALLTYRQQRESAAFISSIYSESG